MLEIKGLSVTYPDGTKAVDDLSLSVGVGESVALVGANGAGKTTLLLAITGVLEHEAGDVSVSGAALDKKNLAIIRQKTGLVFQNPDDQLFMPGIYDDVAFGPRNFGRNEAEVKKIVTDVMVKLGISELQNRSSMKLSGGEKRMAAIAGVLAMGPEVMLFDEPTAFLDPKARRKLINCLNEMHQTKLIATHDMAFALETCETTVLIKSGRVMAEGKSKNILFDEQMMEECGVEAIKRYYI